MPDGARREQLNSALANAWYSAHEESGQSKKKSQAAAQQFWRENVYKGHYDYAAIENKIEELREAKRQQKHRVVSMFKALGVLKPESDKVSEPSEAGRSADVSSSSSENEVIISAPYILRNICSHIGTLHFCSCNALKPFFFRLPFLISDPTHRVMTTASPGCRQARTTILAARQKSNETHGISSPTCNCSDEHSCTTRIFPTR